MSDFPWFKSYPSEVPKTIELNRYNNLVEIFDQSVKSFGDKTAYKNMDVEMSFNEVSAHVDALVWHLQNNTKLKKITYAHKVHLENIDLKRKNRSNSKSAETF